MKLSVLDIMPVRTDQTSAGTMAGTMELARRADELGYERYWLAEHHNMPDIAATNPPVLIGILAAITRRMRLGSGAVLLPNHAPLVVAEQFALLEAAFPGRIELGLGRASGSDGITGWLLRQGAQGDPAARFSQSVDELILMMEHDGAPFEVQGRAYDVKATPAASSSPPVWLLGSSDYSARLAASKGLPYVFAHHFAGQGAADALQMYRKGFIPSARYQTPATFVPVNAVVAETDEEARRRSLPQALGLLALQSGTPLQPQRLIEDAEQVPLSAGQRSMVDTIRAHWVIGSPQTARTQLERLAEQLDVDEIMINPVAGAYRGTDPASFPARLDTLALLAEEFDLAAGVESADALTQ
jgi:luciferase family oxidoreductase group 1